ncbi:MAG: cobalamin biosynthesis protein P47K, partial [Planctomycetota bacterium]|nr:cobalamin biosynthesis protein P47K [Planctomycetota bacterium]
LAISALQGDGFDQLIEVLDRPPGDRAGTLSIDYDVYAEGEAELCWLNGRAQLGPAEVAFAVDDVVLQLVQGLHRRLEVLQGAEPAHVKVLGLCEEGWAMANLVSSGDQPELSCAANVRTKSLDLVVNARVATAPDSLRDAVQAELELAVRKFGSKLKISALECFRPARPEPTHRDVASCD